ncbi:D-alanyl-D-alanine carboxypeptidase family protein [Leifsonia sp. NPDC058230]|uniref:D-alanyl-D-alanine carboxypeptidase family protein n=1 Tax=Leifsonia sp. NPDC058230 TaxID=3346391 RepID=UPI0036DDEAA0
MHRRSLPLAFAAGALVLALAGCAAASATGATGATGVTAPPVSDSAELGPEDGYIALGDSVRLTDDVPAVTKLDSSLRDALERADAAAEARHVEITLVAGWRSARFQQYLFDEAVTKYGSTAEASRWVKPVNESLHQQGKAVDIATADAMDFLSRFGGPFGLCQTYANESWHFELTADSAGQCPPQLLDSTAG